MLNKILLAIITITVVSYVSIALYDRAAQQREINAAQEHQAQVQKDYDAAAKASQDSFKDRWVFPKNKHKQ